MDEIWQVSVLTWQKAIAKTILIARYPFKLVSAGARQLL